MPPFAPNAPDGPSFSLGTGAADFLARLEAEVVQPFTEASGLTAVPFPLDWPPRRAVADMPPSPPHPECADLAGTTPCRKSWEDDLRNLADCPCVQWHQCPFGKWCAVIPAVFSGRCLAAAKLVGYGEMPDDEFAGWVDHLDVLMKAFMDREAAWLDTLMGATPSDEPPGSQPAGAVGVQVPRPPADSVVGWALEYIGENLPGDQKPVTVKAIADWLKVGPAYLSHRFCEQVGMPLSWLIASRRMERAAALLRESAAKVRDIAPQVGYRNPQAFSQAFKAHTRMTPREFRRRSR